MAVVIENQEQSPPFPSIAEILIELGFVIVSMRLLAALNKALVYFEKGWDSPLRFIGPFVVCLAFSVYFHRVRYAQLAPMLRFVVRSSALGILVYLVLEWPEFTLANENAVNAFHYIVFGSYLTFLLALTSLFIPSFILPVVVFILSTRYLSPGISGMPAPIFDVRFMLDMAAYLCLFALPVVAFASRLPPYFRDPMRHTELAFAAFGLHLGNYFWSGVAKLQIGPHPWTWILENQTHKTMLYALENGTLPIGHIPWLVDHIYSTAGFLVIPLNFSIVAFQLFAIVCVFRMSWLKITSIFYDIFHAGIYILGGLFFWPWVWNNFTILLSASRQRTEVSLMAKLMCVLVILLGDVSGFPRSARLAWFDVTDVRRTYFQAVTSDGRTLAVPPSFFLTHSFGVSQGYMDMAAHEGQYRPTIWASAATYDRQLSSGTCPAPGPIDPKLVETEQKREERLDTVKHFVRAQHEKMKAREAIFGADNFYFRSHHHPSNPFLFSEFNRLNLKDVVAYNLVVESACLRLDHGKVEKTVVNRVVDRFDVE